MKICSNCRRENKDSSKYCAGCGTKLEAAGNFCPECGTKLESSTRFCPECGCKIREESSETSVERTAPATSIDAFRYEVTGVTEDDLTEEDVSYYKDYLEKWYNEII